jgi:hypothetical protein
VAVRYPAATRWTGANKASNAPWPANDHDSPLLEPTLAGIPDMIGPLSDQPCLHLDRGYDSTKTRDRLEILGYGADIAINLGLSR